MKNEPVIITVFTPTYNRANLLPRIYNSLTQQTFTNFEWLIVDDGSTDDTYTVVSRLIEENQAPFPVKYYKKQNGGKHSAINIGVRLAQGDLFFILDSDDMLPCESLNIVSHYYDEIKEVSSLAGICGLDEYPNGCIIGSGLSIPQIDCSVIELRNKHHVKGDMKEVFKTSVLIEFPFPEIPNEKFCPEALIWHRITEKYKLRFFNKPIYIAEYQEEGISANIIKARMKSPVASMMTYAEWIGLRHVPLKKKITSAINYYRFKFCLTKEHKNEVDRNLIPSISLMWIWTKPIGFFMHKKDLKS